LPEKEFCPKCGSPLKVMKTEPDKIVYTLAVGAINVHETISHCGACEDKNVYRSESLRRLIPFRCSYGYDVFVFVGTNVPSFLGYSPDQK